MAVNIPRGKPDAVINKIILVLEQYQKEYPKALVDLYRQNSVSVRVRIVNPDFAGLTKPERSGRVWKYLSQLDEEAQGDISTVLLLTPDEMKMSFANFEFDDPIPSKL